jgi:hypothetical protein
MYTPNISNDEVESITPEWYEPFPEPQPFPSGWDLSEVLICPSVTPSENVTPRVEI